MKSLKDSTIFGKFFKELRQRTGSTLRQFCLENDLDPGNISKIERGKTNPPNSQEILERYAACLKIKEGGNDWYNFFDYAAASSGKIPQHIMNEKESVEKLPFVFRTLRGQKVSKDNLKELAELIGKA